VVRLETISKHLPGVSVENQEDFWQDTWCCGRDWNSSSQKQFVIFKQAHELNTNFL
jgi:hypothetical protein